MNKLLEILTGDCRETLKTVPDASVQCCVTSPPYWGLRDYGYKGQIGNEKTPEEFVQNLVNVFREVKRALKEDGTCWVNLGDSYIASGTGGLSSKPSSMTGGRATQTEATKRPDKKAAGCKTKDLVGIPWMVAFALRADGWYLRQDIIWNKPNPMPESVTDRCTKSHEYIFLLSKSPRYYYNHEAIKEQAICGHNGSSFVSEHDLQTKPNLGKKPRPSQKRGEFRGKTEAMEGRNAFRAVVDMRNKRSVWTVPTKPYKGAHFAVYPEKLIEPCIYASTKPGDTVLDPFGGSGTTGKVAIENGRRALLCEMGPEYVQLIEQRCRTTVGLTL